MFKSPTVRQTDLYRTQAGGSPTPSPLPSGDSGCGGTARTHTGPSPFHPHPAASSAPALLCVQVSDAVRKYGKYGATLISSSLGDSNNPLMVVYLSTGRMVAASPPPPSVEDGVAGM